MDISARKAPLTVEAQEAQAYQRSIFRSYFRRELRPEDPIFDPRRKPNIPPEGAPYAIEVLLAGKLAGMEPEFLYAIALTGRIVCADTYRRLSPEDRAEWDAAVEEFRESRRRARKQARG